MKEQFLFRGRFLFVIIIQIAFQAMTDKADQYQAQNAVKENLIQILQDIISEQEEKIETLENHIKGRVRTQVYDASLGAGKKTKRSEDFYCRTTECK